jgi:hypothetical protein
MLLIHASLPFVAYSSSIMRTGLALLHHSAQGFNDDQDHGLLYLTRLVGSAPTQKQVATAWTADTIHQGLISYACKNKLVVAGMSLTTTAVYEYTVTHFMDPEYVLTIPRYSVSRIMCCCDCLP